MVSRPKPARWRYILVSGQRVPWELHGGKPGSGSLLGGVHEYPFDGLPLVDRVRAIEADAKAEGYLPLLPAIFPPTDPWTGAAIQHKETP